MIVPDTIQTLGEAVRWSREQKRMTLRALARTMEISAPYLSDVEHNRRSMTEDRIRDVARITGVDADSLMERSDKLVKEMASWLRNNPEWLAFLRGVRGRTEEPQRCLCPWCRERLP